MASTGSNREAEIAGITPDINPINVDKPKPKNILPKDNTNLKSSPTNPFIIKEVIQTKNKPIKPPTTAKITASNKN